MANWRNVAILGCALTLAAAPVQAQSTIPNVELTAEMWALAGVCSQYSNYTVRSGALADWLNTTLTGASNAQAVMDRKEAKLAQITTDAARVQQASGGRERAERSDELSGTLMTRCHRLTNDQLAGRFFATTTN